MGTDAESGSYSPTRHLPGRVSECYGWASFGWWFATPGGLLVGAMDENNDLDRVLDKISEVWTTKTLEDLRREAEKEDTGVKFDSFRAAAGQRFVIILCATGSAQIERLERVFDFGDDEKIEDWSTLTLGMLLARAVPAARLLFESRRDSRGRRNAVALIAAEPDSIRMLEKLFTMPA